MNLLRSTFLISSGIGRSMCRVVAAQQAAPLFRTVSSWILSRTSGLCKPSAAGSVEEVAGRFQNQPWRHQQVRGVKRGTEYQPKNIKRLRTHGWAKRTRTRGGIEVILRRMLKGRKSLTV